MKTILAVIAALAIAGCSTVAAPVKVEVPVPVPCNVPEIQAPALPVDALSPAADEFEFARALWATVEVQAAYEAQLRVAIDACRKP